MFCFLVLMCFGDKLEEKQIHEIERIQRRLLLSFPRFRILNFLPNLGKVLFRCRWEKLHQLQKNQEAILIPYIRARQQLKQEIESMQHQDGHVLKLGLSSSSMWILCWIYRYRKKTKAKRRRDGDFVLRVSEWRD